MADQKLLNYIKENLEKGETKEQIWGDLKMAGWLEENLKRAFQELGLLEMDVLPGIGDLLERTFLIYKNRFWTFAGIMLPSFLLSWILTMIQWFLPLTEIINKMSLENIDGLILLLILILFGLIFFVIFVVINLLSQTALLFAIKEKEQDMGIKKAFSEAWHKIISYYWISILSTFLVVGGFLLFFVPGIILSIYFNLAFYVLIAEGKTGMNALFRSRQLVKGKWWTVFLRQTLIALMVMGVGMILYFIPWGGKTLTGLITAPFLQTFGFLLYQDLKRFKKDPYLEPPKTATKMKFILMAATGYLLPTIIITVWLFWPLF